LQRLFRQRQDVVRPQYAPQASAQHFLDLIHAIHISVQKQETWPSRPRLARPATPMNSALMAGASGRWCLVQPAGVVSGHRMRPDAIRQPRDIGHTGGVTAQKAVMADRPGCGTKRPAGSRSAGKPLFRIAGDRPALRIDPGTTRPTSGTPPPKGSSPIRLQTTSK